MSATVVKGRASASTLAHSAAATVKRNKPGFFISLPSGIGLLKPHPQELSIARTRLSYNVLALSALAVLYYLGAWDICWELVQTLCGESAAMLFQRLIPIVLVYNVIEAGWSLQFPVTPVAPASQSAPAPKPTTLSPAQRRLAERQLQDMPKPSTSPFATPEKAGTTPRTVTPRNSSSASGSPLSGSRSSSRLSESPSTPRTFAEVASKTLRRDEVNDPLDPDNPESPIRAFEGKYSPKTARALGVSDLERIRKEKW